MSEMTLLLSLLIAGIVPRLALRYLQPILMQVLHRMCEATNPPVADGLSGGPVDHPKETNSGPEFWWRVLNVLAISGSMLLVLTFGYNDGSLVTLNDFLRRTLWLVTLGVFLSVSVVALQIWSRITPAPVAAQRSRGANGNTSSVVVPGIHATAGHSGVSLGTAIAAPVASSAASPVPVGPAAPAGGSQGTAS